MGFINGSTRKMHTIDQNYYSYVNRDTTELAEGLLHSVHYTLWRNLSQNEILSKQINRTKEGFQSLPNIYKDKMYSETKLNFINSSSLYAFLEMYWHCRITFFRHDGLQTSLDF